MMNSDILSTLFASPPENGRFFGVTLGIVTNNKDAEGMGRVKVKFPYLSDKDESFWARVVSPMAGNGRGIYFLPEVEDEVLIAFEQGSLEFPYVLGALWNGKDKPPETNADGKNNIRMIKSRSGHVILFDDTEGDEAIIIVDKSGNNGIAISTKEKMMTINCEGDILVQAKGKLQLSGKGIELKSDGDVKIEGGKLILDGNVDMTGNTTVGGTMEISSDTTIKGNVDIK